jgi:cobalamin biosynthesis Mg chelatase CobN
MNDAAQTAADETTAEDAAPVRTSAPPRPVSGQIPRVSQPPTASTPPKVPPSPAVRSAAPTARSRDGATNERRRATVQVQAMPESGRTLRSTVLVIAGVVVAATIGAAVAWFWMP